MRGILKLLLLLQSPFHLRLCDKQILILRIRPFHLPIKRRSGKHSFDRFKRATCSFRINQVDDSDPDEIQSSKEEISATLWISLVAVLVKVWGGRRGQRIAYLDIFEHDWVD